MKRSTLHDQHQALGAHFDERGGWELPLHYGDPLAEYKAVRNQVGLTDLSARGRIRVIGDDRVTWLQSIISNDVLSLQPGQGLYSALLSPKGKMVTYFRVYVLDEAVMLEDVGEIGEVTFPSLRKFLLFGTKAKMENCVESWGSLLVSGPQAPELITCAFGLDVTTLAPMRFVTQPLLEHSGLVIRVEETGEQDIELIMPSDALLPIWERIWKAGEPLGLKAFGTEVQEWLRIEAGHPKAGPDLNEEIVPPEANLEGKAFSLKKGCYPGQEVVARMDTYGSVRRRLVGLTFDAALPCIPAPKTKIYSQDREVGWISSAVPSPAVGKVIAFGFPLRHFIEPGTELTAEIQGNRYRATVQALPFVAHHA